MKDWTAILPLLGVAVGWLLNQATARRTERLADQRVIKEMLYSLLDLHRLLTALVWTSAQMPAVVTRFRQLLPEAPPPEYEAALDELLTRMVREVLAAFFGQQFADLKDGYGAGVAKLAAVDPVSAYRLRGQESTWQQLQEIASAMQQATITHLEAPPQTVSSLQAHFREQYESEGMATARDLVQDVMHELIAQLDRRTRRKTAEVIAKTGTVAQDLMKEFEGRMQQMITAMAAAQAG